MATKLIITGQGSVTYTGPRVVDIIDFDTTGDTTARISTDHLRFSAPAALDLTVLGSVHTDRLVIRTTGTGSIDGQDVTFGSLWSQADTLVFRDTAGDSTIGGSVRADQIVVTGGDDSVYGRAGSDTLVLAYGASAQDIRMAGPHAITGGPGLSVTFQGIERLDARLGSGDDRVRGLDGHDILRGGAGDDILLGDGGDDRLFGGLGADRLLGNDGQDVLDGGAGGDRLVGGKGADILVVNSAKDAIVEQAGEGIDTVRSMIDFDLGGTHAENLVLLGQSDLAATGSAVANLIRGNDGANSIAGLGGRDDLRLGGDAAADDLFFSQVSDSTGRGRDLVRGFDARGEDGLTFLLPDDIAMGFQGFAAGRASGGTLDRASFDADIAAALDARLGAGGLTQAILWDPAGGNLDRPGHRFLVVDLDNDGAYSAGEDYVIQFVSLQGALNEADMHVAVIV